MTRTTIAVLSGALVALAGCGSDSSSDSSSDAGQTTTTAEATVEGSSAPEATTVFPAADGRIAFRRYVDPAAQTQGSVFTIEPDGRDEQQVTKAPAHTVDDQPGWSPDGKLIVFDRCEQEHSCGVWVVKPDGTGQRPVVQCTKQAPPTAECPDAANASFTPDGRHIVYTASYGKEKPGATGGENQIEISAIRIVDLQGEHPRTVVRLTNFAGDANWGTLSPDGGTLAYERRNSFASDPPDTSAVFAVDLATHHQRRLTPWSLDAGDGPDWAPDSSKILFRSHENINNQGDYYTVKPDGSALARLTRFEGTGLYSASWSPDGKFIAFARDADTGAPDVFTMRADGSSPAPVTTGPAWDSAPDWGPPATP